MKKLFIPVDRSYKEEQFMYEASFCSIFTFQVKKHRNAGDITKICLDGLLWTSNFGENVSRHCKETYFRYDIHSIRRKYQGEGVSGKNSEKTLVSMATGSLYFVKHVLNRDL